MRNLRSSQPGGIVPNTLAPGETRSGAKVSLSRWGSAYVSIHPDPSYGSLSVKATLQSGNPRFRVFTIDSAGLPSLVSQCNQGKLGSETCPVSEDGKLNIAVPVSASTHEVLLVASAGNESGAFTWQLGPDQPQLILVSPTNGTPANVGGFDSAGTFKPRKFLVNFEAVNSDGTPFLGVADGNLVLKAGGQPINAAGQCPGNSCPFKLLATGGSYTATVTLPASAYPSGPGTMSLNVSVTPQNTLQAAFAANALAATAAPQTTGLVLVFDVSDSMGGEGRLDAAKEAAHFVLDGLSDDDWAGLVIYSTHSQTVWPLSNLNPVARGYLYQYIEALQPGGWTSIGDGLYRAQDELDSAFGLGAPADMVTGMLVLTDGFSNCDWTPEEYVYHEHDHDAPLKDCADCGCTAGTVPRVWPWPADGVSPPFVNSPLGYWARKGNGKRLPIISTVGVGADADMGAMSLLANLSGGSVYHVPSTGQVPLSLKLANAFRGGTDSVANLDRVLASHLPSLGDLPQFPVDEVASELLVSVLATTGNPWSLRLLSRTGDLFAPTRSASNRAIFRISNPTQGTWSWQGAGTPGSPTGAATAAPSAFVEVAVRSPCRLVARTAVPGESQFVTPVTPTRDRFVGRGLSLKATVDGAAGADALVSAEVQKPDGSVSTVFLRDDGLHEDGRAGDGVFATRYLGTALPGSYSIRYRTGLPQGAAAATCTRELADFVHLSAALDIDRNGLADWWQNLHLGGAGDAEGDPDQDGLTNAEEFVAHTRPEASDSDGGGESDLSELRAGRDPNDRSDDAIGVPQLVARPGNGQVLFQTGIAVLEGMNLELHSGFSRNGPFFPVPVRMRSSLAHQLTVPADNDTEVCFVARATTEAATSGWSSVVCATPRPDPVAPRVTRMAIEGGASCATAPVVRVVVEANDGADDPSFSGRHGQPFDPTVESSGIEAMLVHVSTTGATGWIPYTPSFDIELAGVSRGNVSVRLRDRAGNVSSEQFLDLRRCDGSGLHRAVILEEAALSDFASNRCDAGKTKVLDSIAALEETIDVLEARVSGPMTDTKKSDQELLASLRQIRAKKMPVAHASSLKSCSSAGTVIRAALQVEYQLLQSATDTHRPL